MILLPQPFFLFYMYEYFICMYRCVSDGRGGQKVSDCLGLELQMIVRYHIGSGIKPGSFRRTTSVHNPWVGHLSSPWFMLLRAGLTCLVEAAVESLGVLFIGCFGGDSICVCMECIHVSISTCTGEYSILVCMCGCAYGSQRPCEVCSPIIVYYLLRQSLRLSPEITNLLVQLAILPGDPTSVSEHWDYRWTAAPIQILK